MANRKPFRRAQERVPGASTTRVKTGYVNLQQAAKNLKKSQIKKCEPYKTLILIAQKLNIPPRTLFFKILRTDTNGGAYIRIIQSASSASSSRKEFNAFVNILQERIIRITPIRKRRQRTQKEDKPDG